MFSSTSDFVRVLTGQCNLRIRFLVPFYWSILSMYLGSVGNVGAGAQNRPSPYEVQSVRSARTTVHLPTAPSPYINFDLQLQLAQWSAGQCAALLSQRGKLVFIRRVEDCFILLFLRALRPILTWVP